MDKAKEKIVFIVNPVSGGKSKQKIVQLIDKHLRQDLFEARIVYTERAQHATELALTAEEKYIVAVGGDGTINEVAQALIGTDKVLGLIPWGSGNGLARHLGMPLKIEKALQLINERRTALIDTCLVNNQPFLCTSGVGFDAYVSALFAKAGTRGFSTYVKSTLQAFWNFQPERYYLKTEEQELELDAFSVTFANASQYGNNAFIAPKANIQDGWIDVCLIKPFPKWQMPAIGLGLFTKGLPQTPYYQTFRSKKIVLERKTSGASHLDGENFTFGTRLEVEIKPSSLHILTTAA